MLLIYFYKIPILLIKHIIEVVSRDSLKKYQKVSVIQIFL